MIENFKKLSGGEKAVLGLLALLFGSSAIEGVGNIIRFVLGAGFILLMIIICLTMALLTGR